MFSPHRVFNVCTNIEDKIWWTVSNSLSIYIYDGSFGKLPCKDIHPCFWKEAGSTGSGTSKGQFWPPRTNHPYEILWCFFPSKTWQIQQMSFGAWLLFMLPFRTLCRDPSASWKWMAEGVTWSCSRVVTASLAWGWLGLVTGGLMQLGWLLYCFLVFLGRWWISIWFNNPPPICESSNIPGKRTMSCLI